VSHAHISTNDNKFTIKIAFALAEYQLWLVKQPKPTPKTKKQSLSTLFDLCLLLGEDFNMNLLNDEIIEDIWLPFRLRDAGMTTAKRDLSFVRGFVLWAADRKQKYSPAKLTFSIKAEGDHYEYLDASDLKLIFDRLPDNVETPWQFWIVVIGLYTGARISEISSLRPEYFSVKSGLNVMFLDGTKSVSSPRTLPIHADLIALGLLDYVEMRKKAKKVMLFDVLYSHSNGWGDEPSGWFTGYKKVIGLTAEMKVFHSFRHTITSLLNEKLVNEKAGSQYTGHSNSHDVRSSVYGRKPLSLAVMQASVVSQIDWYGYCGWSPDLTILKAKADSFL
jgi:integrase